MAKKRVEVVFDTERDQALLEWLYSVRNTSATIRSILYWWFLRGADVERLSEHVEQLQAELEYWRSYYSSVDAPTSS